MIRLLVLFVLGAPLMTQAQEMQWASYACQFKLECVDAEPCAETDFTLSFRQVLRPPEEAGRITFDPATPPGKTEIETDWANFTGFAAQTVTDAGVTNWLHVAEGGNMHLFSLTDGLALYTVHMSPSATVLHYQGTCESEGE